MCVRPFCGGTAARGLRTAGRCLAAPQVPHQRGGRVGLLSVGVTSGAASAPLSGLLFDTGHSLLPEEKPHLLPGCV